MSDDSDDRSNPVPDDPADPSTPVPDDIDDTPTVTCSRCDREWALDYELDELQVGNQAVEQFALDHHRHTGHFPDGVSTWLAECRQCPEREQRLSEGGVARWARTHARHTHHAVAIEHAGEQKRVVTADGE
ncbi:MAG: hypothetical protein ABEH35_06405 [Haloarculaceae archaeon]